MGEQIAREFHRSYGRLALRFGYPRTREAIAQPWEDVPLENRRLMIAVALDLLDRCVIRPGAGETTCRTCGGRGAVPGFWLGTIKTCPACHGRGLQ